MDFKQGSQDKQSASSAPINLNERPGAVDIRSTQADVFPFDAWEFDNKTDPTIPVIQLKDAWVFDGSSLKADSVSSDKIDVNSLFAEEIVVPDGGSIRYETGAGVNKRCVQLADEKIDWLDIPDTTPASAELLRARIGRLGVGGTILMDGDFEVNITSTFSASSVITAENVSDIHHIQLADGSERIAWIDSSLGANLVEKVKPNGGAWGSKSIISTLGGPPYNGYSCPYYIQRNNGQVRIVYTERTGNRSKEKILTGSTWGAENNVDTAISFSPSYIETKDSVLHVFYVGFSTTDLLTREWNDSTSQWGNPTLLASSAGYFPKCVELNSELYLFYSGGSPLVIKYLKRSSAGVWDTVPTSVGSGTVYGNGFSAVVDIMGDIRLYFIVGTTLTEKVFSNGAWGSDLPLLSEAADYTTCIQLKTGVLSLTYRLSATGFLLERTFQRYASLGAGIIESGSNTKGSYTKYSDGTLDQWGVGATNSGSSENQNYFPVSFISTSYVVTASLRGSYSAIYNHVLGITTPTNVAWFGAFSIKYDGAAFYTDAFTWHAKGRWR